MAVKAGTAYVDIQGDMSSFNETIEKALGPLGEKFGKLGKSAAAGIAGIGVAAAGAGKALYDIGASFDDAYDTIRTGTGKTGKELDSLKGSFKNVVSNVPTDFKSASQAISLVNERLNLTGKPLENVSSRFLELSKITGTDLSTNIKTVTRVFGDWSISTKNQSGAMDELFRASQKTGVPVNQLSEAVVKFGAPLRQLGFTFEQSTAMIGKFEKEGVNTNLVMGSMRIALGKMAKAGEDPQETFKRVTEGIKNAGSAGEANKLALELFGAKAGPDMAAAIREGRFELGNLTDQIKNGKDTIHGAAEDTADFSEKWQIFKNRVLVALEPIAMRVFNAVGQGMDFITKNSNIAIPVIGAVAAAIATVVVAQVALNAAAAINPWVAAIAGLVAIGVALVVAYKKSDEFRKIVNDVFDALKDITNFVEGAGSSAWGVFGDTIEAVGKAGVKFLGSMIDSISESLHGLIDFVTGVFTGDWGKAWDGIKELLDGAFKAMVAIVKVQWDLLVAGVKLGMEAVIAAIKAAAGLLLDAGKWIVDQIINAIKGAMSLLTSVGTWIVDQIVNALKGTVSVVGGAGKWVIDQITTAIHNTVADLATLGGWILNRIIDGLKVISDALSSVGGWIKNRLTDLIHAEVAGLGEIGGWITNRLADGIKTITDALGSVGGWVKNRILDLVHAEVDGLTNIGTWIINRLADGITTVTDALSSVGGWIKNRIVDAVHGVADGLSDLGGWMINKIVAGLKGGANLFIGFINDLIGVINKIPGVEIGKVGKLATGGTVGGAGSGANVGAQVSGLAQGGMVHMDEFAKGGMATRPIVVVGEEAPTHPEYVIPTNPAYRQRALGLHAQAAKQLGVPGFALGGVIDGIGNAIGGAVNTAGDIIKDVTNIPSELISGGVNWILDKLPSPKDLGWLSGAGKYVIDKATSWIKDKVKAILATVAPSGTSTPSGPAPPGSVTDWLTQALNITGHFSQANLDALYRRAMQESGGNPYADNEWDSNSKLPGSHGFPTQGSRGLLQTIPDTFFAYKLPGHDNIWNPVDNAIAAIRYMFADYGHIVDASGSGYRKGGIIGGDMPFVGSYKDGGVVPADGMAYVHAGETISPAGGTGQVLHADIYIGNEKIEQLVNVQLKQKDRAAAGTYFAGVRP